MREIYPDGKRDSDVEDASIAATYLMLAEADEGFESSSVNYLDPDVLAGAVRLPGNEKVLMVLDPGYAAEGVGPLPIL